jgi:hypothetical protein
MMATLLQNVSLSELSQKKIGPATKKRHGTKLQKFNGEKGRREHHAG